MPDNIFDIKGGNNQIRFDNIVDEIVFEFEDVKEMIED